MRGKLRDLNNKVIIGINSFVRRRLALLTKTFFKAAFSGVVESSFISMSRNSLTDEIWVQRCVGVMERVVSNILPLISERSSVIFSCKIVSFELSALTVCIICVIWPEFEVQLLQVVMVLHDDLIDPSFDDCWKRMKIIADSYSKGELTLR